MKTNTTYSCETCGFTSPDRAAVEACEAIPVDRIQGLSPGDIIAGGIEGGMGIAHFTADKVSAGWLHEDRGDPTSRDHLERSRGGYNKWVVLDICLPRDPRVNSNGDYGRWGHREVVLLYTPHHCCTSGNGPLYAWAPFEYTQRIRHRLGRVSDEDLARYRAAANGRKASLI